MKRLPTIKKTIRRHMFDNGITQREVARKAGMEEANVSRFLNTDQDMLVSSFLKLVKAARMDIAELLK